MRKINTLVSMLAVAIVVTGCIAPADEYEHSDSYEGSEESASEYGELRELRQER